MEYTTQRVLVTVFGFTPLLVLLLPAAARILLARARYDFFEPLTFVALTTFIGVTARSLYVAHTGNTEILNRLTLGQNPVILLQGQLLLTAGLLAFAGGYLTPDKQTRWPIGRLRLLRNDVWSRRRVLLLCAAYVAIAALGTLLFLRAVQADIRSVADISSKRALVPGGGLRLVFGYHRWAAALCIPAFYFLLIWHTSGRRKWRSLSGLSVILVGILALVFPILTSLREGVVVLAINALVIRHYLNRGPGRQGGLGFVRVTAVASIALLVVLVLTGLRRGATSPRDISRYVSARAVLENIVASRNFVDVSGAALAVESIPGRVDYLGGSSLVAWVTAPIPRSVWENKPPVSLGYRFASDVYGLNLASSRGGGKPPGFPVELYWNFGYAGLLVGMFLLGVVLRQIYRSLAPLLVAGGKNAAALYIALLHPLTMGLLGTDLSQSMVRVGTGLIPILLGIWIVQGRPSNTTQSSKELHEVRIQGESYV